MQLFLQNLSILGKKGGTIRVGTECHVEGKDGNRVRARHSPNPNYKITLIKLTPESNKGRAWNHVWHPSPCNFHGMVHCT